MGYPCQIGAQRKRRKHAYQQDAWKLNILNGFIKILNIAPAEQRLYGWHKVLSEIVYLSRNPTPALLAKNFDILHLFIKNIGVREIFDAQTISQYPDF